MSTRHYLVAGHRFSVTADEEMFGLMTNYEPFLSESGDTIFTLTVGSGETLAYTDELRQEDEGQTIVCGHTADGKPVFEFFSEGQKAGWLVCTTDFHEARLLTAGQHEKFAADNALMILYALATACHQTALFHSSVVSLDGRAYMFLGKSGTGKSTHARLWLSHITGTELVNDDNPVVRISDDGQAVVYGSPWSGKTSCYRNVSYPIGAIVNLSQAPHNHISRLNSVQAYAALVASISGKRWDLTIADGLHQTENALVGSVPVWHLECLPDEDAARLCAGSITNH